MQTSPADFLSALVCKLLEEMWANDGLVAEDEGLLPDILVDNS